MITDERAPVLESGGIKKQIPKSFCILPWIHMEVKPTGAVKMCCVSAREVEIGNDGKKRPAVVGVDAFGDIWNSEYMQKVRQAMLEGRPVRDCTHCQKQAASSMTTFGELNNREWMLRFSTSLDGLRDYAAQRGTIVNAPPPYLQMSLGNECNLKCRMCNSDYSSRIEEDPVHNRWAPNSRATSREHSTTWFKDDDLFVAELIPDPKIIRKLYITGGEPMLSDRLRRILDLLIEHGTQRDVEIGLNTNGTVANRRLLDRLVQFKSGFLGCSIDGFAQYYEYIRFPGKWSMVLNSLERFREYPTLSVEFNPTIQAYNALNIDELYRFCDERDMFCSPQIMYNPEHLTISVLPFAARQAAAARLRSFIASPATTAKQKRNRELAVPVADYLEHAAQPSNYAHLAREFAVFTNDLDRSRGQNFKDTHRELYDYFISSGAGWTEEVRYSQSATAGTPEERAMLRHCELQLERYRRQGGTPWIFRPRAWLARMRRNALRKRLARASREGNGQGGAAKADPL